MTYSFSVSKRARTNDMRVDKNPVLETPSFSFDQNEVAWSNGNGSVKMKMKT